MKHYAIQLRMRWLWQFALHMFNEQRNGKEYHKGNISARLAKVLMSAIRKELHPPVVLTAARKPTATAQQNRRPRRRSEKMGMRKCTQNWPARRGGIYAYGYEQPSAIQQRAIVPCCSARDVIAQAQSGTGKTATFAIALIEPGVFTRHNFPPTRSVKMLSVHYLHLAAV